MPTRRPSKNIAVLIVGYNNEECLGRLFDSIDATHARPDVYFIDNASTDGGYALVRERHPWVKSERSEKNLGFAGANNLIAEKAVAEGAEILFFLNPDTTVCPDTFEKLLEVSTDERVLQPLVLLSEKGVRTETVNTWGNPLHILGFSYAGGHGRPRSEAPENPTLIAGVTGAAMWMPVALHKKIGGFDDTFFMYHEDLDLALRAQLAGAEAYVAPEAVVYHDYEFSRNARKFYYAERNRLLMLAKLYRKRTLLLLVPFGLLTEVALIAFSVLQGTLKAKLSSYGGFFRLLPHALKERQRIQKGRVIDDATLITRMTPRLQFGEVSSPVFIPYGIVSAVVMAIVKRLTGENIRRSA